MKDIDINLIAKQLDISFNQMLQENFITLSQLSKSLSNINILPLKEFEELSKPKYTHPFKIDLEFMLKLDFYNKNKS